MRLPDELANEVWAILASSAEETICWMEVFNFHVYLVCATPQSSELVEGCIHLCRSSFLLSKLQRP